MLKVKLQYFGHLMQRADSFEKTLMLGKTGGRRRGQRMRWLDGITQWTWVWVNSRSWWRTGRPGVLQSMGSQRVRHDWARNWTELNLVTAEIIIALRMPIRRRSLDLGLQCAVHLYGFHPCSRGHYCCCDQAVSAASASRGEGRIAWSHHGRSHPWQGHVEEPWQARRIMAREITWICSSIYPKPESVLLFCAFHQLFWH